MLTDNEKLYDALEAALRAFYHDIVYVFVHAIYEPEDDGEAHAGMYHAAVDLFREGETFHVYFTMNECESITVDTVERWFMG